MLLLHFCWLAELIYYYSGEETLRGNVPIQRLATPMLANNVIDEYYIVVT